MNRTQKKCLVATAGSHLLLLVILVVGPAFLSSHDSVEDLPVIEFVPMITTDKPFSGGGNPNANPQPPTPQPPVQQEQPQVVRPVAKPPTRTETAKPVQKAEPPPKRSLPDVSTRIVTRQPDSTTKSSVTKTDSNKATSPGKAFTEAARRIREGASSSTAIEMPGAGGGGPSYANYAQVVKSAYMHAWIEPTGVDDDQATATVSVTIASNGAVTSAHIIQSSGNPAVDRAVQATLDRVTFIAPFPEGAKENERTYKINFNLKANQLTG
jgi:TonB family protein